jgi:predicted nucleic acid-binding protein
MSILVDSNVLINVIDSSSPWHKWSRSRLSEAAENGPVVINQIVLAETAEVFREPPSSSRSRCRRACHARAFLGRRVTKQARRMWSTDTAEASAIGHCRTSSLGPMPE